MKISKLKFFIGIIIVVVIIFPYFIYKICPPDEFIEVNAITDSFTYITDRDLIDKIHLDSAYVNSLNPKNPSVISGSISLKKNVAIEFTRVGINTLSIKMTSPSKDSIVAFYNPYNNFARRLPLYNSINIYIENLEELSNNGMKFLYPFSGLIAVGDKVDLEPGFGFNSILRSGQVSVYSQDLFHRNIYKVNSTNLKLGQVVDFEQNESTEINTNGLVSIGEGCCLEIFYKISLPEANIRNYGSMRQFESIKVTSSLLDRLLNDPIQQIFSIIIGSLIVGMTFFSFIIDYGFKAKTSD